MDNKKNKFIEENLTVIQLKIKKNIKICQKYVNK